MTRPSAEEDFYRRHRARATGASVQSAPDPGHAAHQFEPGGRYWLVRNHLEPRPRVEQLLEIGCGGGECTVLMQRYAKRCFGCDIVLPPHLNTGTFHGARFLATNANDVLPFADSQFDVVVAIMVLEHLFDPFHFSRELNRITKAGGLLVMNVPLITSIKRRMELLRGRMPATAVANWFEMREWDGGHLHYFTLKDISKLLAWAGFDVSSRAGVGPMHRLKSLFPNYLASEISLTATKRG